MILTGFGDVVASFAGTLASRAAGLDPDEQNDGKPSVLHDDRTNSVILTGPFSQMASIKGLIRALDVESPTDATGADGAGRRVVHLVLLR